jgi:hypothetical protein
MYNPKLAKGYFFTDKMDVQLDVLGPPVMNRIS